MMRVALILLLTIGCSAQTPAPASPRADLSNADLVLLDVGANDVTHLTGRSSSTRHSTGPFANIHE